MILFESATVSHLLPLRTRRRGRKFAPDEGSLSAHSNAEHCLRRQTPTRIASSMRSDLSHKGSHQAGGALPMRHRSQAHFMTFYSTMPRSTARLVQHPGNAAVVLPENPEQARLGRRRWWLRLLLGLLLLLRRRTRRSLFRRRRTLLGRRRWRRRCWRRLRRLRGGADHRGVRALTIGQPDIVDRMLNRMQAGACRIHIQPGKIRFTSPCSVISSTSTKASVLAASVAGRV